ncbi:MAG: molybdopterin-dependent oxidoreductase, partial [Ilumatobacteraceae bacterium]
MSTASGTTAEVVVGSCHHDCPDTCGWHVTIERSGPTPVAVQMRGNPDHPYSKGELCPKVNKFLDRVYSDERVLHPLRRVGPKGEGRFEQITWDAALAEIAARFHEIIDRDGAEAIMPYSDAGNQSLLSMGFPERFWNRLGATRVVRAICGPTVGAGVKMTNGTTKCLDPLEIRHSKLVL